MPVRELIKIDEALCDGCGLCVPSCAEGAIQIVDGKAKLVADVLCDGIGACLGHCPQGALTVEKIDAAEFDEDAVRDRLDQLQQGGEAATSPQTAVPVAPSLPAAHAGGGCPGSRMLQFDKGAEEAVPAQTGTRPSQLRQWPVQLHLVSPMAPYFQGADLLLTADCVGFAMGDFHKDYLQGKALAVCCPKLDVDQQVYLDKLVAMVDQAGLNTLHVMIMQVPCCGGLLQMAQQAVAQASRKIPIKCTVVGVQGDILTEEWVQAAA